MTRANRMGWLAIVVIFIFALWLTGAGRDSPVREYTPRETPASRNDEADTTGEAPSPSRAEAPVETPTPDAREEPVCHQYRVVVFSARVRDCPDTTCEVVTGLVKDDEVCVLGWVSESRDWVQIQLDDSSGYYVHRSVIESTSDETELPIISSP